MVGGETHHFGKPPYIPRAPNDLYLNWKVTPPKNRSFELPPVSPQRRQEAGFSYVDEIQMRNSKVEKKHEVGYTNMHVLVSD